MKNVIKQALFKAICSFIILILLTIGFQYYIWVRYYREYRNNIISTRLDPLFHLNLTTEEQVREYNREIDRELGIPSHFTPDLWPFDNTSLHSW